MIRVILILVILAVVLSAMISKSAEYRPQEPDSTTEAENERSAETTQIEIIADIDPGAENTEQGAFLTTPGTDPDVTEYVISPEIVDISLQEQADNTYQTTEPEQVPTPEEEKPETTLLQEEKKPPGNNSEEEEDKGTWFKLTAYCPCKACSGRWGSMTSTGVTAREGITIAVDPKVIPYGSKVTIDGYGTYVAEDCGVRGNQIDIYFNNHQDTVNFGVRYAYVKWN